MITTDQPAWVSTSAMVEPPGPEPMMMASTGIRCRRSCSSLGHLGVGESPRLHVAIELRVLPTDQIPVPPVLGCSVHSLAGVVVHDLGELGVLVQSPVLLFGIQLAEILSERSQALLVALLEADHGPVELSFGEAPGSLQPGSPGQFV